MYKAALQLYLRISICSNIFCFVSAKSYATWISCKFLFYGLNADFQTNFFISINRIQCDVGVK